MHKKKRILFTLAAVLLLSAFMASFGFVSAKDTTGTGTPTPGLGLLTPEPTKTPKPTATPGIGLLTPSPTPTATPDPHEGHDLYKDVLESFEYTHTIRLYCRDCKTEVRTYTENHTLDAEGVCSVCGYACTHNWEHDSYKNDENTETHIEVLVCTVCGTKTEKRAAHKPMHIAWEDVSNKHHLETVRCNMCEFTYTLAPTAHKFVTRSPHSYKPDENNEFEFHRRYDWKCEVCGAIDYSRYETAPHDFGDAVSCRKCGQRKAGHMHRRGNNIIKYEPLNATQHIPYYVCVLKDYLTICGTLLPGESQPHTFDPVTLKCTVCGYLKEGCEHRYTYKPIAAKTTPEKHTLIGTCSNCGKQITVTENHVVSSVESINAQEHRLFCAKCSSYITQRHNFKNASDSSAHVCSVCGKTAEHGYSLAERRNDKGWEGHTIVYRCKGCAHQKEEFEDHNLVESYEQRNKESHVRITKCTLCAYETKAFLNHTFDEKGVCSLCGYIKTE